MTDADFDPRPWRCKWHRWYKGIRPTYGDCGHCRSVYEHEQERQRRMKAERGEAHR